MWREALKCRRSQNTLTVGEHEINNAWLVKQMMVFSFSIAKENTNQSKKLGQKERLLRVKERKTPPPRNEKGCVSRNGRPLLIGHLP